MPSISTMRPDRGRFAGGRLLRFGVEGNAGRSDLSWDDAVRLDLYYVENWSPALDAMILWKTLFAVVRGKGAY